MEENFYQDSKKYHLFEHFRSHWKIKNTNYENNWLENYYP